MTRGILAACVLWIASVGVAMPRASAPQAGGSDPSPTVTTADRAVVDRYCVTCHNQRFKTSDLRSTPLSSTTSRRIAEVWEKVIRKVGAGMMPPAGVPRPDDATRRALVSRLEDVLDRAAKSSPNPGRPLVHRLNRAEYANAIRDLLALDVDVTSLLPPDDSSSGFDNIADVLGLSPVLLESYLTAAERISALAIGDPKTPPMGEVYRVRQDASQDRHVEGLPLGTVGGLLIQDDAAARRRVPVPGQAVSDQPRDDARARVSASARDHRRRRTRASRVVRRRRRRSRVERQPDDHGRRDRWTVHGARAAQGRSRAASAWPFSRRRTP